MKKYFFFLTLAWVTFSGAEEPSRTWTSKHGLTVQGSYQSMEDGTVTIKKPSGDLFKTKLDSLCTADIDYVKARSFSTPATTPLPTPATPKAAPKTVKMTLLLDPNPNDPSLRELGVSPRAKMNDTLELNVTMPNRQDKEVMPDSVWLIESLTSVSGTLKATTETLPPLTTEGLFYFLSYNVENKGLGGSIVPAPILQDTRNRRYYPLSPVEKSIGSYIPAGMSSAEMEMLRPEFKRQFCSVYEVPKDAVISRIEIFPLRVTRHPLYASWTRSGQLSGKAVDVNSDVPPQAATSSTLTPTKVEPVAEKPKVFMSCKQKASKGTGVTHGIQTRVLAYTIDLRLTKPQQKEMTIKAFFIATDPEGDGIVDVVDQQASLQQGKSFSTTVESKPVREVSTRNENTVFTKLKGVIIQLWADGEIVDTWVSNSQWDKQAKLPDLELKMRKARINNYIDQELQDRDRDRRPIRRF